MTGYGNPEGRNVAVTITPAAGNRDSRALKQAASLARAGFQSILLEGKGSNPAVTLPSVCVVSMTPASPPRDEEMDASPASVMRRILRACRKRVTASDASWIEARVGFIAYLAYYGVHFLIGGLRYIPPASLYYLSEFSFYPALWIKSRLHGAAIAYDARDFYVGIETSATKTPFQKLVVGFGRMIERRCIQQVRVFTTVGDGIASLFEAEFGRRPDVIYNAHDNRIDRAPDRSLRHRLGLADAACVIVIVGQAKPGQEFSGVFGALGRLDVLNVAFIGNGYRELFSTMDLPKAAGDRIHFVENLPATEVVPLIRTADASLIVYYDRSGNYRNALPNGFFQSVAAELPVLYGGLPEMSRVCKELEFGFSVAPDDADGMTAALQMVIEKTNWYTDQKARSKQAARKLAWQNQEAKLIELLNSTLERGGK